MNPTEKDISNIFDNLTKFISGSNSLISIFAGLLDFLNTSYKELVRKYILKIVAWLVQEWSYYPSSDLKSKIIIRLFVFEKDPIFYNSMADLLKKLIDSFWENKYQKLNNFEFHGAIFALYLFYLQLLKDQINNSIIIDNKVLDLRESVLNFNIEPRMIKTLFYAYNNTYNTNSKISKRG